MKKNEWEQLQHININDEKALCENCKNDLSDILNFRYTGKNTLEIKYLEELCTCKNCGSPFITHYDIYDKKGHIYLRIFSEDVNNPSYNWQDVLSEEQKDGISKHLKKCKICQDRLSTEMLNDALLSSFIKNLRKKESLDK